MDSGGLWIYLLFIFWRVRGASRLASWRVGGCLARKL